MNQMDSGAQSKMNKPSWKEFFRYNKVNFYIAGIFSLLALLAVLAASDEYACSAETVSGTVVSFTSGRYASYRPMSVREEAVVRLKNGSTINVDKRDLTIGQSITFRQCTSKILKRREYEQIIFAQ